MTTCKYSSIGTIFRYTIALCCGALLTAVSAYRAPSQQVVVAGATAESALQSPLATESSVFLEELTWIDVRDRIRSGTKSVVVPTGGIEQNGPFVALNKHDQIVREVCARAARRHGKALVAPVVSFVPQGEFSPPSGHLRYPGTISVTESTFEDLLVDIGRSLATHGFTTIALLGDSGDSQRSLRNAADRLQTITGSAVSIRWIESYYDYTELRSLLLTRGITTAPEQFHEELSFTAQLAAIDPHAVRLTERLAAGYHSLNGFDLSKKQQLIKLGDELLDRRAEKLTTTLLTALQR